MGFCGARERAKGFGRGLGSTESVGLGFLQEAVAALGDALKGEMAEGDTFHFFDGMQFLEEGAPENIEFGADGVDFVPEIGGAAAG